MSYDPIPDLAGLFDGLTALFDQARGGATNADLSFGLGLLAADVHHARLRGGLLLDEPGHGAVTTEAAIREALGQQVIPPPVPDSTFAYIDSHPGEIARHRDLPVTNAATAVTSWTALENYYRSIWPDDRYQAVRRRLLTLAGNLPGSEREKMPAWLLRLIHSDLREPGT